MDQSKEVKARANSSKIAFFFLWFNLINFCLLGVDVITNMEKTNYLTIGATNTKEINTSTTFPEKVDRVKANRANELGTSIRNQVEVDRTDKSGTGIAILAKVHGVNKLDTDSTDPADLVEADGKD